jgi:hypothetical protein
MAVFLVTKDYTLVGQPGAVLPIALRNYEEPAPAKSSEEETYRLNLPKLEVVEGGLSESAPPAERKSA